MIIFSGSIRNTRRDLSITKRGKSFSGVCTMFPIATGRSADFCIVEEKYGTDFKREERGTGGDTSDASTDSTDSEAEDDDGILVSEELDAQIRATLQAIRRKDPRVYDEKTRFYSDLDNEQEEKTSIYKAQTKPMYLRDYHRENLLGGDLGTGIEDEQPLTYAQQQDDLRQTVIKEMHSVAHGLGPSSTGGDHTDGDEDFLVRKEPKMDTQKSETNGGNMKFDPWAAEKDPETFLSSFMSTRAWVGIDGSKMQPFESDDEEEERRADIFEEAYNLRFEDPKGSNEKLLSHARDAAAKYSVRKDQSNSRKKARELETAKKEVEKREREAEKARLRKLRIADIGEKIKKIKDAAGLSSKALEKQDWTKFIDEFWDDDRWEQEMKKRFGDEYYEGQESEGSDPDRAPSTKRKLRKPKWDDDIEIQDILPDFEPEKATNAFNLDEGSGDEIPIFHQSDVSSDQSRRNSRQDTKKAMKKAKAEQRKEARQQRRMVEEIVDQKLSEDLKLSSFRTKNAGHFRYRETSPLTFGLSANDILLATDSQLNQFAGLKKMAAFRDKEKKKKDKKRLGKKARLRQWRKETFGNENGPQTTLAEVLASKVLGEGTNPRDERQGAGVGGGKQSRSRKKARSSE